MESIIEQRMMMKEADCDGNTQKAPQNNRQD